MAIANATTWNTSLPSPDWGSTGSYTNRMNIQTFGDGIVARIPIGINIVSSNPTYNFSNLDLSQYSALYSFFMPLFASGNPLYMPDYYADVTGATSKYFFVSGFTPSSSDGLMSLQINLTQIFG